MECKNWDSKEVAVFVVLLKVKIDAPLPLPLSPSLSLSLSLSIRELFACLFVCSLHAWKQPQERPDPLLGASLCPPHPYLLTHTLNFELQPFSHRFCPLLTHKTTSQSIPNTFPAHSAFLTNFQTFFFTSIDF